MSRPLNFDGDPIIRMRWYVRKSTDEDIRVAALIQKKHGGEIIDDLVRNKGKAGPQNKKTPEDLDI